MAEKFIGTVKAFKGLITGKYEPVAPTFLGAMISERERKEFLELGPAYWVGSLYASGLEAIVFGKGFEYAWKGVKKIPLVARTTTKFSQAYQTSRLAKYVYKTELSVKSALPSFKGSKLDVYLAKHWGWYYGKTGGIARGEVAIPRVPEVFSMAKAKSLSAAFELTVAPRTSGIWVSSVTREALLGKPMKHLIFYGGKLSVGYLRELGFEKPTEMPGLLPYVTQKQVTRMGIIPYAPKIATSLGKKATLEPLLGLGAATLPRLVQPQRPKRKQTVKLFTLPKVWQPTLAYEREAFRTLEREAQVTKQREQVIPIPKLAQAQKTEAKQVTRTIQREAQKLISIPKIPKLTQLTTSIPFYPRLPRGGQDYSKMTRDLFGKWFKREHKILTPQQIAKSFGLSIPKTRRKKATRKRKKKATRRKRRR